MTCTCWLDSLCLPTVKPTPPEPMAPERRTRRTLRSSRVARVSVAVSIDRSLPAMSNVPASLTASLPTTRRSRPVPTSRVRPLKVLAWAVVWSRWVWVAIVLVERSPRLFWRLASSSWTRDSPAAIRRSRPAWAVSAPLALLTLAARAVRSLPACRVRSPRACKVLPACVRWDSRR